MEVVLRSHNGEKQGINVVSNQYLQVKMVGGGELKGRLVDGWEEEGIRAR